MNLLTTGYYAEFVGLRYGNLVITGYNKDKAKWACKCDCGKITQTDRCQLVSGRRTSCGCLSRLVLVARSTKHGRHNTSEYYTWQQMIQRCYNPKRLSWKYYGARGITVCDRWRFGENGKSGFECFFADMGKRPRRKWSGKFTLDRRNNDGNYEPRNCRWTTYSQQNENRRPLPRTPRPRSPRGQFI